MSTDTTPANAEISDVQQRLMQMLESVRLEKSVEAEPAPAAAPSIEAEGCPNCHSTVPWNGASWCPACGFYPKLGRVVMEIEQEEEEEGPINIWEFIPSWSIWVAGGVVLLFAESLVLRLAIPDAWIRGQIAIMQILAGLFVFAICHARAYFIASQKSEKISPASFFAEPAALWQHVFKDLPDSNKLVIFGANGAAAALLALTVIGLDWNGLFQPQVAENRPKFSPMKAIMQGAMMVANMKNGGAGGVGAMSAFGGGGGEEIMSGPAGSFEGSLGDFANAAGVNALTQAAGPVKTGSMEDALSDFAGAAGVNDLVQMAPASGGRGGRGGGSGDFENALGDFAGAAGVNDLVNAAPSGGGTGGGRGGSIDGALGDFANAAGVNELLESGGTIGGSTMGVPGAIRSLPGGGSGNPTGGMDFSNGGDLSSVDPEQLITSSFYDGQPNDNLVITHVVTTRGISHSAPTKLDEKGEFVVFGYLTNAGGDLRSVLLAQVDEKKRGRYVGRLSLIGVPEEKLEQFRETLDSHRSVRAALPSPYRARWTNPVVRCFVAYDGWTAEGHLRNGMLLGFEAEPGDSDKTTARNQVVR
ncbi:MAG: hypothetical protein KDA80_13940 [Planctomycetaceae bacterium]|nr:hypothetical protein [Planctomycetaceae bacterium]